MGRFAAAPMAKSDLLITQIELMAASLPCALDLLQDVIDAFSIAWCRRIHKKPPGRIVVIAAPGRPSSRSGMPRVCRVRLGVCRRKNIETGALSSHREASIVKVCSAGTFRRNHAGTNGCLRRTGSPEDFALPGLDNAF